MYSFLKNIPLPCLTFYLQIFNTLFPDLNNVDIIFIYTLSPSSVPENNYSYLAYLNSLLHYP